MGCCSSCLKPSQPEYQSIPNPSIQIHTPQQIDMASTQATNALLESSSSSYQRPSATAPIEINPSNPTTSTNGRRSSTKAGFFVEYDLKEEIGVGSTAKCFRCVRKSDNKEFACKVVDKRTNHTDGASAVVLEQFMTEIKVLRTLDHPNIVKLVDTFESADRIYVVMEYMKGGELFDYVVEKGTLSEAEASVILRKITSAVAHMHGLNIIHRDLKPENLLLTSKGSDAEIKLIDFGLAKEMEESVTRSFLGTRGYLAPEMLQRNNYDKAIDIWALGIIAFVLLCGCLPFDDDSSKITSESAARKKFTLRFPQWASSLSTSAKDLLHNLLDVNPKTRFTAEQALNHSWISGKSVQANNYLQSPSIMAGERRKEMLKSPMMQAMQSRMNATGNPNGSSNAVGGIGAGFGGGGNYNNYTSTNYSNNIPARPGNSSGGGGNASASSTGLVRKNSI